MSTRKQALIWGNTLSANEQYNLIELYFGYAYPKRWKDLTGREIEEIWRKEVGSKRNQS